MMVTENMINKLAKRLYIALSFLENLQDKESKKMNFEYLKIIKTLIEDIRYFIIFLESIIKENKLDNIVFEKDIRPIMDTCKDIETLFNIE